MGLHANGPDLDEYCVYMLNNTLTTVKWREMTRASNTEAMSSGNTITVNGEKIIININKTTHDFET